MARQREFNKDEVIERAISLFAAQGYEATSIRDLIASMRISRSSMYEAFGDKRRIFLLALERFCKQEQAYIAQMAQRSSTPQAFIKQLFATIETIGKSGSGMQGSLAFNAMVEFGTQDRDVTKLLLNHYFAIAEIVREVIAKGQKLGTVTSRKSARHLAYVILSALQGMATVKGVHPDFSHVKPMTQIMLRLLDQ